MINKKEIVWSIANGLMTGGKPYILRFREFYPTITEQKKLSYLIEIIWNYHDDESGMPSRETYEKMLVFEDILNEQIDSLDTVIMVATVTGKGKKFWQFYVADIDSFMNEFNKIMDGREKLPLHFEMFQDEEWNGYKELVSFVE